MDNCIIVGNGMTRTIQRDRNSPENLSWKDLMESLFIKRGVEFDENEPLTLGFERLANTFYKNNPDYGKNFYNELKEDARNLFAKLKLSDTDIINRLRELDVQNVITTNYDSILEEVFDAKKYNLSPTKYLLSATHKSEDGKYSIFHPHGSIDRPSTITMGYEHYMGIIQKMKKGHIINILNGKENANGEWFDLLFTNNVGIIGFNLSTEEVDFWYLLAFRARLLYEKEASIKNRIIYYDTIVEDNPEQKRRHRLLESMGVEVHSFTIGKDVQSFAESYGKSIDEMKKIFV